jgi:hypothetical protein
MSEKMLKQVQLYRNILKVVSCDSIAQIIIQYLDKNLYDYPKPFDFPDESEFRGTKSGIRESWQSFLKGEDGENENDVDYYSPLLSFYWERDSKFNDRSLSSNWYHSVTYFGRRNLLFLWTEKYGNHSRFSLREVIKVEDGNQEEIIKFLKERNKNFTIELDVDMGF